MTLTFRFVKYKVTTKDCKVVYFYNDFFVDVAENFLSIFDFKSQIFWSSFSFKFINGYNRNIGYAIRTKIENAVLYLISFFCGHSVFL